MGHLCQHMYCTYMRCIDTRWKHNFIYLNGKMVMIKFPLKPFLSRQVLLYMYWNSCLTVTIWGPVSHCEPHTPYRCHSKVYTLQLWIAISWMGHSLIGYHVDFNKHDVKFSFHFFDRPVSAYALFFRDTQAAIKTRNPSASFGEVSKIVASMWDGLNEENKGVCSIHNH